MQKDDVRIDSERRRRNDAVDLRDGPAAVALVRARKRNAVDHRGAVLRAADVGDFLVCRAREAEELDAVASRDGEAVGDRVAERKDPARSRRRAGSESARSARATPSLKRRRRRALPSLWRQSPTFPRLRFRHFRRRRRGCLRIPMFPRRLRIPMFPRRRRPLRPFPRGFQRLRPTGQCRPLRPQSSRPFPKRRRPRRPSSCRLHRRCRRSASPRCRHSPARRHPE